MFRQQFHSTTPAKSWSEGLMLGTGSIGASLFEYDGGHAVALSHERSFVGTHDRILPPAIGRDLATIRRLASEAPVQKQQSEAIFSLINDRWRESGHDGSMLNTDALLPAAWLVWQPLEESSPQPGTYRRYVDWAEPVAGMEWIHNGNMHSIIMETHRDTQTVELCLQSEAVLRGTFKLIPAPDQNRAAHVNTSPVDDKTTSSVWTDGCELVMLTRSVFVPRQGFLEAETRTAVSVDNGTIEPGADGALLVSGARRINLRISVRAVSVEGEAYSPGESAYWNHEELFNRSALSLNSNDNRSIEAARADPESSDTLIEFAYAAGRHAIISSTGALPPTLQGVWSGAKNPAWSSDYTMNGNVQNGGITSMLMTGTPELLKSFFNAVGSHLDDYKINARQLFDAPGYLLPARFSSHGLANHFSERYPHGFWTGGGGWVLRFAWDYFSTTGDQEFLKQWAWPFAREVMAFYEHFMVRGADGRRHAIPSYSPENRPSNQYSAVTVDATCDIASAKDAAIVGARLALLFGDEETAARWTAFAEELPRYRVSEAGYFAEWLDPKHEDRLGHRHATQLYGLWYDPAEILADPALVAAVRKTIRTKLAWRAETPIAPPGRMEMAFGLVQLGQAAAAIGDSDSALQCVDWLARLHWGNNMMSLHDAGKIFNVDASGGLPAVVASMLVRSDEDALHLLPALPQRWSIGEITGIRARGGITVQHLSWTEDFVSVKIQVLDGTALTRTGPDTTISLPWPAVGSGDGLISADEGFSFAAVDGASYNFTFELDRRPGFQEPGKIRMNEGAPLG